MARRLAAQFALGLGCASGAHGNFVPFSNVEELKPRRIRDFCSPEAIPGQDPRIRRCQHHFKKTLEDESDIELGWQMEVDPDSILSLDTEAEHGVRLARCGPGELELELPESHARHAAEGMIIVGSRFVHNCAHRPDHQLYHRVREVRKHEWRGETGKRVAQVHLLTEELESIAHVVPKLSFFFQWMPSEAKKLEDYPEMKTDYGLNREYMKAAAEGRRAPPGAPRRLFKWPSLPSSLKNINGVDEDSGGFASGGKTSGNFDNENGILNLMPKQLSNFGWNWNFFMNTTQEPVFDMDAPGLRGRLKVRQPFIKVHAGIFLNFSSAFPGLTITPTVKWRAGVRGHGRVQARVHGSMNTTGDAGTDPFHAFKLPVLEELENPLWFEKVDFATGALPISMEPGFKCSASMYHHGRFKGALGVGGKTRGWLEPSLTYDSVKGFDAKFLGDLEDTQIWPPMWLMFTRQFELGIMLKPSLLMRGDFAGLERATMAIDTRPYVNISIVRGNGEADGVASDSILKALTVYPMRVTGIEEVSFFKKYMVKIDVNGQEAETSAQVNWGTVEYKDHISNFDCGMIPQSALMNTTRTKFLISLIMVDNSGPPSQTTIGTGVVVCSSILNGECQPSPANVVISDTSGKAVAAVQIAILWQNSPAPWFSSKIRGLSFSFPQVIVRQDTLTAAFPNTDQPEAGSQASQISMHLIRGGQTYIVPLTGTIGSEQSALAGSTQIEFGPSFTDTWKPCAMNAQMCISPTLELYAGATQIATATMPLIEFASQTAMQGTAGGFMGAGSKSEMNVPSTIALAAPGNRGVTIALATMEAKADMVLESSMFLQPRAEVQVVQGGSEKIQWTICDVLTTQAYTFTLTGLRLNPVSPANLQAYTDYRKINNFILEPIAESVQTFTSKCNTLTADGVQAKGGVCKFDHDFSLATGFSKGDTIVVQITWSYGGMTHEMYSPPMLVGAGRRLLGEPAKEAVVVPDVASTPRRLWSQEAWNARIDTHAASCNKEDMKFRMGMGVLMRGKIDSISVPKGFPMIGGLNEEPELTTGFRRFELIHPSESAADFFGGQDKVLCQMGLCKGYLPGCSKGGNNSQTFPRLVFDFSRPFHFGNGSHGKFNGLMKTAMAYAFSTLPEMVDVVIQKLNTSKPKTSGTPVKVTASDADFINNGPSDWWKSRPTPAPAPSVQWPTKTQVSAPAQQPQKPQDDALLNSAFNKWWSGATTRRLADDDVAGLLSGPARRPSTQVGDKDELPSELDSHQVSLEFKEGLPYIVDRPLVELMLQNGYFKTLEDVEDDAGVEHGSLAITRFYIDSGIVDDKGVGESSLAEKVGPPASAGSAAVAWSGLVVFAAALGAAAVTVLRAKHHAPAASRDALSRTLSGSGEDESLVE